MHYELQLNPFIHRAGWKYKKIQITNIQLHTNPKPQTSIGKKLKQAFQYMKPGRIYSHINAFAPAADKKQMIIDLIKKDPDFLKYIQEQERNGYKVLLELPEDIPVLPGPDTIDFINSTKGQRLLRWLAKKKPTS